MKTHSRGLTLGVVAGLALMAGCSSTGTTNRAGGSSPAPTTVLTFANVNGEPGPALIVFATDVAQRSKGTVRIQFKNNWRKGSPSSEQGSLEDVKAHKVDLAWAGTRAFDSIGITAFDPLHAPLLIDSQRLQQAVLTSALPAAMLTSLTTYGVKGLGIMPGPLRKPLGVTPLVTPADYKNKTLALSRSGIAEATFAALGAKGKEIGSGGSIAGTDGVESQVSSIAGNNYDHTGKFLSGNVNLWPRPVVVFMNPEAYSQLNPSQQTAVTTAASAGVAETTARELKDQQDSVERLCRRNLTFLTATDADLARLRTAVQSVYDRIEQEPANKAAIEQILALKAVGQDVPDTVTCAGVAPAATTPAFGAVTAVDGHYRLVTTPEDLRKAGAAEDEINPANYGTTDVVLDRGRFAMKQVPAGNSSEGSFVLSGHTIVFIDTSTAGGAGSNQVGEEFTFHWSLYHDLLTLTAVPGKISPAPFRAKPLRRLGPAGGQ